MTLLSFLLLLAGANQDSDVFTVAELVHRTRESPTVRFGSHLLEEAEKGSAFASVFLPARDPSPFLSLDALQQLIRHAAGAEAGAVSVEPLGESLLVRAPAEARGKVKELLDALRLAAGAAVEVELSLYDAVGADLPGGAFLDPASSKALAARTPLAQTRVSVPSGGLVSLRRRTERALLTDYDVEVATRSAVADPILVTGLGGFAADARVHALADGSVHLTIVADRGDLLGVDPFETKASRVGVVEIPRMAVGCIASTLTIREGATAALAVRGSAGRDGGGLLVALRAKVARPLPPLPSGIRLLPCDFLAQGGGRNLPSLDDDLRPFEEDGMAEDPETVPAARLLEWLRRSVGDARYDAALGRGNFALAASDCLAAFAGVPDEIVSKALSLRSSLESGPSRTFAISLDLSPAAGAPVRAARLAATVGRACGAVMGVESTRVADYDVEVAQRAAVADPMVVRDFDGFVFRAILLAAERDRALVEVDLRGRGTEPRVRFDPKAEFLGAIEQASTSRFSIRRVVSARLGEPLPLGEVAPPGAEGVPLTALLTVTSPR